MADRDSILMEFQAFTCLENLDECITILEQHEWNLQEAVQNTLARLDSPQHHPTPMMADTAMETVSQNFFSHVVDPSDIASGSGFVPEPINHDLSPFMSPPNVFEYDGALGVASSSSDMHLIRLLDFRVEYRDRNVNLRVPDNEKVGKIKELLHVELGIPAARQELHGWIHKNDTLIKDEDFIRDLKLPKQNSLFLLTPDLPANCQVQTPSENSEDQKIYELFFKNRENDSTFSAKFPGSKTVCEVKFDVYPALNIPVRHQVWYGWPDAMRNDKMTLASCGLDFPIHRLEVSSSAKPQSSSQSSLVSAPQASSQVDESFEMDSDVEPETFEDIMMEEAQPSSLRPLMPNDSEDQTVATEHFVREFGARYGETHPVFFIGSLEDVLKESLQCRARDRKLLAIYLHHDNSILSNVFCSQILCTETVVSFLSANFIVWAWDLTHNSNKNILLRHCTTHFGSIAANTVRQFCPDKLPLLLVISRNRSTNEVMEVIDGSCTLNDIMARLIHALEMFRQQVAGDIQEENEREERERMLAEQDAAYQESLALDRAKVESKRREEDERRKFEEVKKMKLEEEERRKQKVEEEKEALRQSLANQLPNEPPADATEPTTTFRIRCPEGQTLTRRFYTTNTLSVLMNYITSKGFHVEGYKVLQTYPRRDLTQLDQSTTFAQLNIGRQETLTLEHL